MAYARRLTIMVVVSALLFGLGMVSKASAYDLEVIEKAITAHHARWVAGETSLTQMSIERLKSRFGWIPFQPHADKNNFVADAPPLPASFDWRDLGVVSGVRDQGDCGSCWAFSSVGALESLQLIEDGGDEVDDSEQFLISYNFRNHGCHGGVLGFAADFLKNIGTVSEACMPYRANGRLLPLPCKQWQSDRVGIEEWSPVGQDVASLKAAVYKGPVPAGMYVFEDFLSYTGGVYSYVSGKLLGGHGILIVGWDDAESCFIVKNSWGESWGEGGFFRIAYSEVQSRVQFGTGALLYGGLWRADTP